MNLKAIKARECWRAPSEGGGICTEVLPIMGSKYEYERECECECGHEHKHKDGDVQKNVHEHERAYQNGHGKEDPVNSDHSGYDDDEAGTANSCHCGHDHGAGVERSGLIKLLIGGALFALAMMLSHVDWSIPPYIATVMFFVAYIIVGYKVLFTAAKNILRGQVFDENFLMGLATIGAFLIGQFEEGVAVMVFYQVGELFQDFAVGKSRASITSLMNIRPDYANLKDGENILKVAPEEVKVGQEILIKAGEKIPLDGIVLEGRAAINTLALTGEALPREVEPGSTILSGCINENGLLTVRVTKEFGESTVAKILKLVESSQEKKAKAEHFITKFARYYTPVVVFLALGIALIPPLVMSGAMFSDWIYRGLLFLVISCPCALVISIPLSFFAGIGGASKLGILVKGGNYLEVLAKTEIIAFDKTGTLTKGVFKVISLHPSEGISEGELLKYCAYAESFSNHPIAKSIVQEYGHIPEKERITKIEEIAGQGMKIELDGAVILAGNRKLMASHGIESFYTEDTSTCVQVVKDGVYLGVIVVGDQLKSEAKEALAALRHQGIRKTVMLTGDSTAIAQSVATAVGIDECYAELLPAGKVERVEALLKETSENRTLGFVGDGINDAPVLARADIGIAMGGLGSDAAIEAADIVLMTDELSKLAIAKQIAQKTMRIAKQNIVFAIGVKIFVLGLGAFGFATMWEAVFADVGVTVIAILNATRTLWIKNR